LAAHCRIDEFSFISGSVKGLFLSSKTSKLALDNIQSPTAWVQRAFPMGFKGKRCESDYSPPGKEFVELYLLGVAVHILPLLIGFKDTLTSL